MLSDGECKMAGLPPCPRYQDLLSGEPHLDLASAMNIVQIRKLQRQAPDRQVWQRDIVKLEKQLVETEKFWARQEKWRRKFEEFVDLHKIELLLALKKERLTAIGRKMPQPTFETSIQQLQDEQWRGWNKVAWTSIPFNSWISTGINWEDCRAESTEGCYVLILIDTATLLDVFPHAGVELNGVMKVGDSLVINSDESTSATPKLKRGRKPYPWEELYVEITRRIQDGKLPEKQESFISEMEQWCSSKWGKKIGRSTLLEKVSPYYDAFVRSSEKSDK